MIRTSSVSSSPRACGRDTRTKGGEMVHSRGPLCPKMWTAVDHSWEQFNTIHLLYVYSTVYMWFEASSCITLSNITRRWDNQGTTALRAGDIAGTYHAENKRWTTSGHIRTIKERSPSHPSPTNAWSSATFLALSRRMRFFSSRASGSQLGQLNKKL